MSRLTYTDMSCGVGMYEDHSWNGCRDLVAKFVDQARGARPPWAYVIFSDVTSKAHTNRIIDELVDNGLGDVYEVGSKTNPNSGNSISIYVWDPVDLSVLRKWLRNN